jgi:hypothetical protein
MIPLYGIRNLILAKLGVALLEVGLLKEIGSPEPESTLQDIINARKILLEGPSAQPMLPARYFKIAQKCIDCDFSCGDDLDKEELRSAVYTDVVCGLETMIKTGRSSLAFNKKVTTWGERIAWSQAGNLSRQSSNDASKLKITNQLQALPLFGITCAGVDVSMDHERRGALLYHVHPAPGNRYGGLYEREVCYCENPPSGYKALL